VTTFMSMLEAVHGAAPGPPHGEFDVETIAEDGTRRSIRDHDPVGGHDPGPPDQGPEGQRHLPGR
jgi:hypothetical protein